MTRSFNRNGEGRTGGAGRGRLGWLLLAAGFLACSHVSLEPFATTERGFFPNGPDRLHYAFDLPKGVARPPIVILAHSSGRVTADVNARYAEPLVQRGFAVLRFDKRGVGQSDGVYSRAFVNLPVLAGDVLAALEFIRDDARIDPQRIGLMGYSQAGWVVPHAAARSSEVAFVILLAGPTVTGHQQNYWDAIADDQSRSIPDLEAELRAFVPPGGDFDPRPDLEALTMPALWIYGAEDRIVPTGPSVEILQDLVASAGKPFTVMVHPGVGHRLEVDYWTGLFAWLDREIGGGP